MTWLKRILKSVFGNSVGTKPARFRPVLESLEERACPAISVTTADAGHTLLITGDNAANFVQIRQDDSVDRLSIDTSNFNDPGIYQHYEFESSDITKITVQLGHGNDVLTYALGGGSDFEHAKNIGVNVGTGDDFVDFNFQYNGVSDDAIIYADLALGVIGEGAFGPSYKPYALLPNRTDVHVDLGDIDDANVTLFTHLGAGNDHLEVLANDLRGDSTLTIQSLANEVVPVYAYVPYRQANGTYAYTMVMSYLPIDGNDTYNFELTGEIDSDAQLTLVQLGGGGNDIFNYEYSGNLDGTLSLNVNAGSGSDTASVWFDFNEESEGILEGSLNLGTGIGDVSDVSIDAPEDNEDLYLAALMFELGDLLH